MRRRTHRALIPMHKRVDMAERVITAFMFGYEAAAVAAGDPRVPTISSVCAHHRWLAAVTVLGLVTHLVLADYAEVLRARAATPINQL